MKLYSFSDTESFLNLQNRSVACDGCYDNIAVTLCRRQSPVTQLFVEVC